MTITLPDEAVEAGAKVQWDRDEILSAEAFGHPNKLTPWEDANGLDRAEYMRDARAAITAALEQMVESGRATKSQLTVQDDSFLALIIRLDSDT